MTTIQTMQAVLHNRLTLRSLMLLDRFISNINVINKGAHLGGSRGARAPLLFCPPQGIHTLEEKNLYIPEIPRLVHPCYLGRMGAPAHDKHFMTL